MCFDRLSFVFLVVFACLSARMCFFECMQWTCLSSLNSAVKSCHLVCLLQYNDVVLALKRGDLRLLRHALEEHEDRYKFIFLLYSII